jgi:hypothetical protein
VSEFNWLVGLHMVQCQHPKNITELDELKVWLESNAVSSFDLDINQHILNQVYDDLEWRYSYSGDEVLALFFVDENSAMLFKLSCG